MRIVAAVLLAATLCMAATNPTMSDLQRQVDEAEKDYKRTRALAWVGAIAGGLAFIGIGAHYAAAHSAVDNPRKVEEAGKWVQRRYDSPDNKVDVEVLIAVAATKFGVTEDLVLESMYKTYRTSLTRPHARPRSHPADSLRFMTAPDTTAPAPQKDTVVAPAAP